MELDVTKALLTPGTEFPFTAADTLPPLTVTGETVTFGPVSLAGMYSALDGVVRLEGTLNVTAHAACAMCLKPVDTPLEIPFNETFRKDANELEDEDFRYEGDKVPLTHLALTITMLNLPMRFLCREDCRGNEQAYGDSIIQSSREEEPQTQRPFEALKDMLAGNEETGKPKQEAGKAD